MLEHGQHCSESISVSDFDLTHPEGKVTLMFCPKSYRIPIVVALSTGPVLFDRRGDNISYSEMLKLCQKLMTLTDETQVGLRDRANS